MIERASCRVSWPYRMLALTTLAAVAAGCAPATPPRAPGRIAPLVPQMVRVGQRDGSGQIRELPLEQYVLASVLTEIVPSGLDREAARRVFEVQAIVARTYAAANLGRHRSQGFDLCNSTHCQLVDTRRLSTSSWRAVAEDAVARTAGRILVFEGRPAQTVFHADCGGHTSAAHTVWNGDPVPYLRARHDDLPGGARHRSWTYEATAHQLAQAVALHNGPSTGGTLSQVEVLERDVAGRVIELVLRGRQSVTLHGTDFRAALGEALKPPALRSTLFSVSRKENRFVFEGRGFGHGVGLCQVGAMARANAGQSPRDILGFYYPGTSLWNETASPAPPQIPRLRPRGTARGSF